MSAWENSTRPCESNAWKIWQRNGTCVFCMNVCDVEYVCCTSIILFVFVCHFIHRQAIFPQIHNKKMFRWVFVLSHSGALLLDSVQLTSFRVEFFFRQFFYASSSLNSLGCQLYVNHRQKRTHNKSVNINIRALRIRFAIYHFHCFWSAHIKWKRESVLVLVCIFPSLSLSIFICFTLNLNHTVSVSVALASSFCFTLFLTEIVLRTMEYSEFCTHSYVGN